MPDVYREAEAIVQAYGFGWPTQKERRAYADVLDRMGAFGPRERQVLIAAGLLGEPEDPDA